MGELHKGLDELCSDIIKFSQCAINVPIDSENKDYIMQNYEFNQFLSKLEDELSYNGRILVRPSGTESVIRIMVEGDNEIMCQNFAKQIEKRVVALNLN